MENIWYYITMNKKLVKKPQWIKLSDWLFPIGTIIFTIISISTIILIFLICFIIIKSLF